MDLQNIALLRVLRHRNYRIYVIGDGVSLIGTWVQRVGVGWLTWELTESGVWLGIVAFADLVPSILLGPLGGVISDRGDPKRVSIITQFFAMIQALLLCLLTVFGWIDVWWIALLSAARGSLAALNQPARMSLIPPLVPREELSTAIAFNSVTFNTARFIGPAVAGIVIAVSGVQGAFAINALSYVALLYALYALDIPAQSLSHKKSGGIAAQAVMGFNYASRHPGIAPLLLIFAAATLLVRPLTELLPGIADGVFGRGAEGLAWMTSIMGLGAMVGGGTMVRRSETPALVDKTVAGLLVLSLSALAFSITPSFWLAMALIFAFGFATSTNGIGTQTLIQGAVDDALRGRVMSLYGVLFRGGPAIGALTMGIFSDRYGLRAPLAAGATVCLIFSAWAITQKARLKTSLAPSAE